MVNGWGAEAHPRGCEMHQRQHRRAVLQALAALALLASLACVSLVAVQPIAMEQEGGHGPRRGGGGRWRSARMVQLMPHKMAPELVHGQRLLLRVGGHSRMGAPPALLGVKKRVKHVPARVEGPPGPGDGRDVPMPSRDEALRGPTAGGGTQRGGTDGRRGRNSKLPGLDGEIPKDSKLGNLAFQYLTVSAPLSFRTLPPSLRDNRAHDAFGRVRSTGRQSIGAQSEAARVLALPGTRANRAVEHLW